MALENHATISTSDPGKVSTYKDLGPRFINVALSWKAALSGPSTTTSQAPAAARKKP